MVTILTRFGPSTCRRARTTVMAMAVVTSVNAFANPRGPILRHQAVFQEIVEVREHAACRCLAKSANLSRFNVSMYFNTFSTQSLMHFQTRFVIDHAILMNIII